jgi:hypothetical protein
MELLPGQKTWPNSLSVNARVCAGFVSPTVYFYLSWISENGTTTGKWTQGSHGELMLTAFAEFYQIQVIPVIGLLFTSPPPLILSQEIALISSSRSSSTSSPSSSPPTPLTAPWCCLGCPRCNSEQVAPLSLLRPLLWRTSFHLSTEILSPEALKEGRRQLDRHKRLMERATRRASLKEKINRNTGGITKLSPVAEIVPRSLLNRLMWWRKTGTLAMPSL